MTQRSLPVLDHGFVKLLNVASFGGECKSIADVGNWARMDFDKLTSGEGLATKLWAETPRHCYHPSMQVLTAEGWKNWNECREEETFLVPNPETKTLTLEKLAVKHFEIEEELYCFKNKRMEYKVTSGHRMWVSSKYGTQKGNFSITKVEDMSCWGHFAPGVGFKCGDIPSSLHPFGQLLGFILGDGYFRLDCAAIEFHLKKERKILYLKEITEKLGVSLLTRKEKKGSITLTLTSQDVRALEINNYIARSGGAFKELNLNVTPLSLYAGILDGLVSSDGNLVKERDTISFCSTSKKLVELFEFLSIIFGRDAHRLLTSRALPENHKERFNSSAHGNLGRTSLELRSQYFYKEAYKGLVYCTTSSTGLLIVRGSPSTYSFLCGNSSPFETIETWWHLRMPIFCSRHFFRTRTASYIEHSGRYFEFGKKIPIEFYNPFECCPKIMKSMSESKRVQFSDQWVQDSSRALHIYQQYLELLTTALNCSKRARELARNKLPVELYTEFGMKINLLNLLKFLYNRRDKGAQWETQQYANAMFVLLENNIEGIEHLTLSF